MASVGLTREDVAADEHIKVDPDLWPSVSLFLDMMSQWRMGPSGPVSLDYAALPAVFDIRDIPADERSSLFDDIRIMEVAAIHAMRATR